MCATLWSGARYFKSNLVKEWPKKENTLEDCVKRVYERSMRHDDIPLLSTWESYASSLPVREFCDIGTLPLYKFPYWSNVKDLADQLIRVETMTGGTPRGLVSIWPHQHDTARLPVSYQHFCTVLKKD